jgi:hypothetical protein
MAEKGEAFKSLILGGCARYSLELPNSRAPFLHFAHFRLDLIERVEVHFAMFVCEDISDPACTVSRKQ